jgi:hypothetical protein
MKQHELIIKMILDSWLTQVGYANKLLEALSDDRLHDEIAPGRNRGIYLLGHLASVHDRMLPLLDFGQSLYPDLYEPFVVKPDREVAGLPTVAELRAAWHAVNSKLEENFKTMTADQWLEKHTSVSAEDFAKEPHRNKLNIVLNRTTHLADHFGQLLLLK